MPEMRLSKNKKDKKELEADNVSLVVNDPKHVVYWQVQIDTIQALHKVGIHFQINDRIPVMKIFVTLEKMLRQRKNWEKPEEYPFQEYDLLDAEMHLNRLVRYRQEGYEPPSEKEKYI